MDIQYLHGVGPKRAELLAKQLDIHSFYDLLYYFPFRYIDKSKIHPIREISGEMPYIQIRGHFVTFAPQGQGAKRRLTALFSDGTGVIEVVWFNRVKAIQENIHPGVDYILFGKPTLFNGRYSIAHPEIETYKPSTFSPGLRGIYNLTETLRNRAFSSRTIQQLVDTLLQAPVVKNISGS